MLAGRHDRRAQKRVGQFHLTYRLGRQTQRLKNLGMPSMAKPTLKLIARLQNRQALDGEDHPHVLIGRDERLEGDRSLVERAQVDPRILVTVRMLSRSGGVAPGVITVDAIRPRPLTVRDRAGDVRVDLVDVHPGMGHGLWVGLGSRVQPRQTRGVDGLVAMDDGVGAASDLARRWTTTSPNLIPPRLGDGSATRTGQIPGIDPLGLVNQLERESVVSSQKRLQNIPVQPFDPRLTPWVGVVGGWGPLRRLAWPRSGPRSSRHTRRAPPPSARSASGRTLPKFP